MEINDNWETRDDVSGLRIKVVVGKGLNCLHIEHLPEEGVVNNRDFFFDKDGKFDGTGSSVCEQV